MSIECYTEGFRKARKAHKCCECHRPIAVGERHLAATGIWDGEPDTFRLCAPCAVLRADILKTLKPYDYEEFYFGELGDWAAHSPDWRSRWDEIRNGTLDKTHRSG